uniref:Uncharacterized protein n=1 Tax=Candidatus Methanogaster sp. ANME-2c ERB4 TaxID=2759911 RepID=A0A7G9Y4B9_9EURY|nr:hypothetical protein CGFFPHHJ_00006 [Methanosarcinales archaeon ANME-2c ERB4]
MDRGIQIVRVQSTQRFSNLDLAAFTPDRNRMMEALEESRKPLSKFACAADDQNLHGYSFLYRNFMYFIYIKKFLRVAIRVFWVSGISSCIDQHL